MTRKQFMKLPMIARREILRCQTDLLLANGCVEAVKSFCKHYNKTHLKSEPQPIHWTIAKLLDAGRALKSHLTHNEPDLTEQAVKSEEPRKPS